MANEKKNKVAAQEVAFSVLSVVLALVGFIVILSLTIAIVTIILLGKF
ncbi:MAG: hypothetical protein Q3982_01030 [Phoenicibacter congonensis]|uniref:Uncharacterized protein n=1 Tax=Phoenicibacter congonensis TaxID=1944646 RepID=A0AA43RG71_9ACTN|nr:hypothetical protein [Phoenicibacter congonensis]